MPIGPGNVKFSYAQLEGLWIQAGGNPQSAMHAAAIATRESGGNSAAYNINTNHSIDRGLWQINSVNGAQSTFDIMANARAAVHMSNNGTNWGPWATAVGWERWAQQGVAPDMNVPINGTNAAANQPMPAAGTTTAAPVSDAGANTQTVSIGLPCILDPACLLKKGLEGGSGVLGFSPTTFIMGIIGMILNPLISLVAGVIGMTCGGAMMIIGLWMMFIHTESGEKFKQGVGKTVGLGVTAAGVAAGQPELLAAGAQMGPKTTKAAARQRITTIRGQQVAERQQNVQQGIMAREQVKRGGSDYRQDQQTVRAQLRSQAQTYSQQSMNARQAQRIAHANNKAKAKKP